MPDSLAQRLEEVPPRLLLPRGSAAPEKLTLIDALSLPGTSPPAWLALATDANGQRHTLPIVDDGFRPRRARAGDGCATSLVGLPDIDMRGWQVRILHQPDQEVLLGAVTEESSSASAIDETFEVSGRYRVRIIFDPASLDEPPIQPWRHLASSSPHLVSDGVLDVVWSEPIGGLWVSSSVTIADGRVGPTVAETLNREVTRHLRGHDTADHTLAVAELLGVTLADAHAALATSSNEVPEPTRQLGVEEAGALGRRVKDVLSEAVVLTAPDVRENLLAGMRELRASFDELAHAGDAIRLPPVPLGGLEQYVVTQHGMVLDPTLVTTGPGPHLAVMDVARLLRAVTHVAHGALRRMVSGAEDVPAERVPTWVAAVRERILDSYGNQLHALNQEHLVDMRLLRAFEIEAECRALVYASRELPTWSSVPDAGLLELLSPW